MPAPFKTYIVISALPVVVEDGSSALTYNHGAVFVATANNSSVRRLLDEGKIQEVPSTTAAGSGFVVIQGPPGPTGPEGPAGSATLEEVLDNGNETGPHDIIISTGQKLLSEGDGAADIGAVGASRMGSIYATTRVRVGTNVELLTTGVSSTGALTIAASALDDITLTARGASATFNQSGQTALHVSFTGAGRTSLVGALNALVDGTIVASAETLAATLAAGNLTGGTDLVVSNNDDLVLGSGAGTSNILWNGTGSIGSPTMSQRPDTIYVETSIVVGNTITVDTDSIVASQGLDIESGATFDLYMKSADASGASNSGSAGLESGATTAGTGATGTVFVGSGQANGASGDLALYTGDSVVGDSGPLWLTTGNSPTNIGSIRIRPGGGAGTGGFVQLDTSSAIGTLNFATTNVIKWQITAAGHLITGPADNTYDIGAVGTTRPRRVYVGTEVVVGNTVTIGTDSIVANGNLEISAGASPDYIWVGANSAHDIYIGEATGTNYVEIDAGTAGISINCSGGDIQFAQSGSPPSGVLFNLNGNFNVLANGTGVIMSALAGNASLSASAGTATVSSSGAALLASSAGTVTVAANNAAQDLILRGRATSTNFNQTGQLSLHATYTGATRNSIIGALNALVDGTIVLGGAGSLAATLAIGNTTGANNIVISNTQRLTSATDLLIAAADNGVEDADGYDTTVLAGNALLGFGGGGRVILTSGLPVDGNGGFSGDIQILSGITSAFTGGESSGGVLIQSGEAAGQSGGVDITTGAAQNGTGGLTISTGANAGISNSGNISISTGSGYGVGSITISTPAPGPGNGANISLSSGAEISLTSTDNTFLTAGVDAIIWGEQTVTLAHTNGGSPVDTVVLNEFGLTINTAADIYADVSGQITLASGAEFIQLLCNPGTPTTEATLTNVGFTVVSGSLIGNNDVSLCGGPTNVLALFGAAGAQQATVTGSQGGNAALASLLTALANYGLIVDSTTA